jgi:hypothetical protein
MLWRVQLNTRAPDKLHGCKKALHKYSKISDVASKEQRQGEQDIVGVNPRKGAGGERGGLRATAGPLRRVVYEETRFQAPVGYDVITHP